MLPSSNILILDTKIQVLYKFSNKILECLIQNQEKSAGH